MSRTEIALVRRESVKDCARDTMNAEGQTIDSGTVHDQKSQNDAPKKRKPGSPGMYQRIDMPTPETIAQEDFMNNCAVRTILSGVMGTGLGVAFGIFMGTMDTSVRVTMA